jgi:hypothetical protein
MARPQRYTEAQVIAALTHTKGMVHLAAKHLGCDPDTVQRYCQRYPSVQATKEAQRGEMVDQAELWLWQSIQRGEPWAITFTLRTLGRTRGYGEKIEQAGPQDGPLVIKVVYAGHEPGKEA